MPPLKQYKDSVSTERLIPIMDEWLKEFENVDEDELSGLYLLAIRCDTSHRRINEIYTKVTPMIRFNTADRLLRAMNRDDAWYMEMEEDYQAAYLDGLEVCNKHRNIPMIFTDSDTFNLSCPTCGGTERYIKGVSKRVVLTEAEKKKRKRDRKRIWWREKAKRGNSIVAEVS